MADSRARTGSRRFEGQRSSGYAPPAAKLRLLKPAPHAISIGMSTDHTNDMVEPSAPQAGQAPAGAVYAFVGDRLRDLRKRRGLTQVEMARIISVSPQQYQKYEDAKCKCSLTTLIAFSDHFEVPLASLLPSAEVAAPSPPELPKQADIATDADLLARLVGAFVKLRGTEQKTRLVQLVEAIQNSNGSDG
jgi:transcriptional regulator with XRE-family HTH domain